MAMAANAPDSPVFWPGAKAKYRGELVSVLAGVPHGRYVEPFCGGAWVLLGKLPVAAEWLNDADGELVHFFRTIADPETRRQVEDRTIFLGLHSREMIDEMTEMAAGDLAQLAPVERAVRFLLVNRIGGGQGAWQERPSGAAPSRWGDVIRDALAVAHRLRAVHIEHGDGVALIERLDGPDTLFYVDPPYLDDRKGRPSAAVELHQALAAALGRVRGKFLLTHPTSTFWWAASREHKWEVRRLGREYNLDNTYREMQMIGNVPLAPVRQGTLFS